MRLFLHKYKHKAPDLTWCEREVPRTERLGQKPEINLPGFT